MSSRKMMQRYFYARYFKLFVFWNILLLFIITSVIFFGLHKFYSITKWASLYGVVYESILCAVISRFLYKISSNAFTKKVVMKREQRARQDVNFFFKNTYQRFRQMLLENSEDFGSIESRKLADELTLLREAFLKSQKPQSRLYPDWNRFSKAFYHLAVQCETKDGKAFKRANYLHLKIRRLLFAKFQSGILRVSFIIAAFCFFVLNLYFTPYFLSTILRLHGLNLFYYYKLIGHGFFFGPAVNVGIGVVVALVVYEFGGFWLRTIVEKTRTDVDDILAGVFVGPVSLFFFALFVYRGYIIYIGQVSVFPLNPFAASMLLVMCTWLAVIVFNRLIVYWLRKLTQSTEQKYDDMLVILFQIYGTFIIVAIGMAILLFLFRDWFGDGFGVDVMIPYSILVSVFSAILGFASKDSLENFLGGALISMDQPFKLGERIMLPGGEVCDVIEIGMRTTKLYNVTENTEIYIPNMILSNMTIANFSRPDSELRVQIPIFVATNDQDTLKKAEIILMDIAYNNLEVDNARIVDDDLTKLEKEKERISIMQEIKRIRKLPGVESAIKKLESPRGNVGGVSVGKPLFLDKITKELIRYRKEFKKMVDKESLFEERSKTLSLVLTRYQELEETIAAISDQVPEIRDEFHPLVSELARDPDVYSQFGITDDGSSYVKLSLVVFSTHLERRYEVVHRVNREIEERFREMGIPLLKNLPKDLH